MLKNEIMRRQMRLQKRMKKLKVGLQTYFSMSPKLGPCMATKIGNTAEETWMSCHRSGCPMLPDLRRDGEIVAKGNWVNKSDRKKGLQNRAIRANMSSKEKKKIAELPPCYAHQGKTRCASSQMDKRHKKDTNRYKVATALKKLESVMGSYANIHRFATIGDPSGIVDKKPVLELFRIMEEKGLVNIGYVKGWRKKSSEIYRPFLRASVQTEKEARQARARGWKVAIVLEPQSSYPRDIDLGDGLHVKVCPNFSDDFLRDTTTKNKMAIDCNRCVIANGGCAIQPVNGVESPDAIGFIPHGPNVSMAADIKSIYKPV